MKDKESKMSAEKIQSKREQEKEVVSLMIGLYCKKKHKTKGVLCDECKKLDDYAKLRSDKCPFMETKTFCSNCKVMGSDSDMPVMAKAADILEQLGISYEMTIISAHREPDVFFEYAKTAEEKGFKVIIAGAGMAAHLPGMCAAIFPMPVIGIPMHTTSLGGRDSLYSIVQMPSGIPVATVAINGGANAGLLAAKILATSDPELLVKLKDYSKGLKESVQKKDARLQEVGYKNY